MKIINKEGIRLTADECIILRKALHLVTIIYEEATTEEIQSSACTAIDALDDLDNYCEEVE